MAQENVRKFLQLMKDMEQFFLKLDDMNHEDIIKFATAHGYEFTSDELKVVTKEMLDRADDELPAWIKSRLKQRYLRFWID
jgi:predicted ribosomally synthesized peptide with nif11-like leader